jgi:hypothetical protein
MPCREMSSVSPNGTLVATASDDKPNRVWKSVEEKQGEQ